MTSTDGRRRSALLLYDTQKRERERKKKKKKISGRLGFLGLFGVAQRWRRLRTRRGIALGMGALSISRGNLRISLLCRLIYTGLSFAPPDEWVWKVTGAVYSEGLVKKDEAACRTEKAAIARAVVRVIVEKNRPRRSKEISLSSQCIRTRFG
ncbi:hypothetical protein L209DRAFT_306442 [Thermothelomyces heterothallicus CBS 203.75]